MECEAGGETHRKRHRETPRIRGSDVKQQRLGRDTDGETEIGEQGGTGRETDRGRYRDR